MQRWFLFSPLRIVAWWTHQQSDSRFTSWLCFPLRMHSKVSPANPVHVFPLCHRLYPVMTSQIFKLLIWAWGILQVSCRWPLWKIGSMAVCGLVSGLHNTSMAKKVFRPPLTLILMQTRYCKFSREPSPMWHCSDSIFKTLTESMYMHCLLL